MRWPPQHGTLWDSCFILSDRDPCKLMLTLADDRLDMLAVDHHESNFVWKILCLLLSPLQKRKPAESETSWRAVLRLSKSSGCSVHTSHSYRIASTSSALSRQFLREAGVGPIAKFGIIRSRACPCSADVLPYFDGIIRVCADSITEEDKDRRLLLPSTCHLDVDRLYSRGALFSPKAF